MAGWLAIGLVLLGCSSGTPLDHEEMTVACGMCVFKLGATTGCYWAAEVDGGHLPVTGPGIPMDHDAHGPGGMCTMTRTAKITGTRYDDKIWADSFELVPVDPTGMAVAPEHRH
ncbi:MAG: hypothetical protein H6736_16290 [Alphaproteobacteria bacterium]|nr:hypothetical protein [Alphaproteobacteria bacterium]MCB9693373.1 hypothetical protein [Alphaproteobacteria bacterium]